MKRHLKILTMTITIALVASACAGSGDDAATFEETAATFARSDGADGGQAIEGESDFAFGDEPAADLESPSEPTAQADDDLGTGGIDPVNPIDLGRDIIYTATVTVEVNDVAAASREATQIMQSFGGLLFGQETQGGPDARTTLIFRVLPTDFAEALDRLGSIGSVRDQRISADDVTERVVDLQSRINTAAASVERLQALLAGATNINDVAELENQLLQRETNLETLRGQLRTVQDQVDLATITLTITEAVIRPEISVSVTSYPGEDDQGLSCPGANALTVDEGTITTVCFEIRNSGDSPLTEITLADPVLEVSLEDLEPVFIQPADILEPGQSAVYFLELPADQTLRLQTRVGAVALDDAGEPIPGRTVADTATATIQAVDPGGVPTFADGVESSWNALVFVAQLLVLAIGAVLPFIWILGVFWLWRRWRIGRNAPTVVVQTAEQGDDGSSEEDDPELVDA